MNALWDTLAFGEWDPEHPGALQVLKGLSGYLAELKCSPLERASLETQAIATWTVEGLWALQQALRQIRPETALRSARTVIEPWIRGEFLNAAPTAGKVLRAVQAAVVPLRDEFLAREAGEPHEHLRRLRAIQVLGLVPLPSTVAAGLPASQVVAEGRATHLTNPDEVVADAKAAECWRAIRDGLAELLSEASFQEWIVPIRPGILQGKDLLLTVPSSSTRLWLEQQLKEELAEAMERAGMSELRLVLQCVG